MKNTSRTTTSQIEILESRIAPAFSGAVNLGALTAATGFHLDGIAATDSAGFSVADAGDVNNDGYADIIVGAPGVNNGAGAAYVILGKATGIPVDFNLSTLNGTNGFVINAAGAGSRTGAAVASAGDFNGDGYDDILVGAPGANNNNGQAFIVFGRSSFTAFNLAAFDGSGVTGVKIEHFNTGETLGSSVSGIGDFNGDGLDDVVIGAPFASPGGVTEGGAGYVILGRTADAYTPNAASIPALQSLGAGFRIQAQDMNDHLGTSVSRAGDVNGDGFDDLIIGAPNATAFASADAGASYVLFGHAGVPSNKIDLNNLPVTAGFKIDGAGSGDQSGVSVRGVGDVNGDGFSDLIIGASTPTPGAQTGESYLVYGRSSFAANYNLVLPGTLFNDGNVGDLSGVSVSGAGDFNGDGLADLLISAPGGKVNGVAGAGKVYVVLGSDAGLPSTINLATLNGGAGFHLDGVAANDGAGMVVSAAGDVNGDGFSDILIGAPGVNADGKTNAGSTFVVYGSNGGNDVTLSADHKTATYTDADGDRVTVKTSKGKFDLDDFHLSGLNSLGGSTLRMVDLTGHTDFEGAKISFQAKPQMINGVVHGDGLVNVGDIEAPNLHLNMVKVKGDLGQINAAAIKSLTVNSIGALGLATQGGRGADLSSVVGDLGNLTVKTGVEGALLAATKIGNIKVGGDLQDSQIYVKDKLKSLTVGGDLGGSQVLGGYTLGVDADAQIGKIIVKGNWNGSTVVAGVKAGADGKFGTADDAIATGGNPNILSRIASIVIGGQANGSFAPGGNFAIEAQQIGSLKIGGTLVKLNAKAKDDFLLGATGDFRLHEVA